MLKQYKVLLSAVLIILMCSLANAKSLLTIDNCEKIYVAAKPYSEYMKIDGCSQFKDYYICECNGRFTINATTNKYDKTQYRFTIQYYFSGDPNPRFQYINNTVLDDETTSKAFGKEKNYSMIIGFFVLCLVLIIIAYSVYQMFFKQVRE